MINLIVSFKKIIMFKLFKRKPKAEKELMESPEMTTVTVEQIHEEFNTAADKLLNEAKNIIAGIDADSVKKSERMKRLGFTSSVEVVNGEKSKETLSKNEAVSNTIIDYSRRYPLYKFITHEDVIRVCNKYNLVAAPVSCYIGTVPEKNLKQIEEFSVNLKDVPTLVTVSNVVFYNSESDSEKKKYTEAVNNLFPKEVTGYSPYAGLESIVKDEVRKAFGLEMSLNTVQGSMTNKREMIMCAPPKEFNLEGLGVKNGVLTKPTKKATFTCEDPVVLQRVFGGYLIVTAWGPEASDPLVVNEKMN
jgi:hypothetical protein